MVEGARPQFAVTLVLELAFTKKRFPIKLWQMPVVTDSSTLLHGFQLWLNLPAAKKMVKPHYQVAMSKHAFYHFEETKQGFLSLDELIKQR